MPITTKELKNCTILSHHISRSGGQHYERENEETFLDANGEEIKTWNTKKVTKDKDEFDEATRLQSKVKRTLNKFGVHSPMGVIVNRDKREEIERVAEECEAQIAEFNSRAKNTKIDAWVTIFDLEGRNLTQLEKVIDRMFNLLGDLSTALDNYDVENIRQILKKTAGYSELLPQAAADAFDMAVENARKKAREISKYDKRSKRIAAKIESETSGRPVEDVVQEAQQDIKDAMYATEWAERKKVPELKKRVFQIKKLVNDREDSLKKLEEAKATINKSAIERARFAVMRKRGDVEGDDQAGKLQGAQEGARFAKLAAAPSNNGI